MRGTASDPARAPRAPRALSLPSILLIAAAAGCADAEELAPLAAEDCSVGAVNERVYARMQDAYLWYDELPAVDPRAYASPEDLVDAITYKDLDRWTRVTRGGTTAAYYEGQSIGIGVKWRRDAAGAVRFALVYPGGPAADAGIERGDELLALNGATPAELDASSQWATITGEDAEGVEVRLDVRKQDGQEVSLSLAKRVYDLPTVIAQGVLDLDAREVGYVALDRFITPSLDELTAAFAALKEAGVEDLVLDLRYNGGGLTEGGRRLASLIGGKDVDGRVYNLITYNDRHRGEDTSTRFELREQSLDLPRVAIITTDGTASTSEAVINGLRSWLDVGLIGSTTHGKPVGMVSTTDCGVTLIPITFRMLNADGEGDYYDGLGPDCEAEDGLTAALGDASEPSLAAALEWLRKGSCPAAAPAGARRTAPVPFVGPGEDRGIF
ncbi:MAG: PDZ domain-containing protein [Polyangiaceae bacterium]|nr:PDZ domain-containing protein [Polyangiaceae bacterium]